MNNDDLTRVPGAGRRRYQSVIPAASTSALLHVMDVSPMPSVTLGRPPVSDLLYEGFSRIDAIPAEAYDYYGVKRGLRNKDGSGVVAGITTISNVHGYRKDENGVTPDEGDLFLRGYSISDLVEGSEAEGRFGYEEVSYLLLTGQLPTADALADYRARIDSRRELPTGYLGLFPRTTNSTSIINVLQRATLLLYAFDETPDDTSPEHEIDVAISLIARLPRIAAIAHAAYTSEREQSGLTIAPVTPGLSLAETILAIIRGEDEYDQDEARVLDIMLMLHAEHGGGNNSTFTTRVLSSSGTDAYSAYAAAMGSLKGPKHGGANYKVDGMIADIAAHVPDASDERALQAYLDRIVEGRAYDGTGLIYGMGHAVYTLSDPRARLIRQHARHLAQEKGMEDRLALIEAIERLAPDSLRRVRGTEKAICANIDLYSGFVYDMLGVPADMHVPVFAIARLSGWVAHRMEELYGASRIIRPAYRSITVERPYVPMAERKSLPPDQCPLPLPDVLGRSSAPAPMRGNQ